MNNPFSLPSFVTPFAAGMGNNGFGSLGSGIGMFAPQAPSSMAPAMAPGVMPASATMPKVGGIGGVGGASPGWLGIEGLGANVGTLNMGLSGLETIGKLWAAFESQKLAKAQFGFQKEFANTNLNNQIRSYNTALTDRATTRAIVNGQSNADRDAYIQQNRATRGG
jgi:hypothetical protein